MKLNYKKLLVLFLVLLPIFISGLALAESKTTWEEELLDVSRFKSFSIKYEEQLGEEESLDDYIYVLNDKNEKTPMNVMKSMYTENMVMISKMMGAYDFGKTYTLVVRHKLENGNGEVNKTKFTIEKKLENPVVPSKDTPKEAFEFEKLEDGIHIKRYDKSYGSEVKIPNQIDGIDVTVIGNYAFSDVRLNAIGLPSHLKLIEEGAFAFNNLQKISFPDSLEKIDRVAFSENILKEIKWNDKLRVIGANAFGYNQLMEIICPNSIEFLGVNAFSQNNIKNIVLSDKLTEIPEGLFYENSLTKVKLPKTIKILGKDSFYGNEIQDIELPEGLEVIDEFALSNNKIDTITLPNSLKEIGMSGFSLNNLKSIELPEGIETIGEYALANNHIENLDIPNSVMKIGASLLAENNTKNVHISNPATTYYPNSFDEITVVEVGPRIKLPVAELFKSSDAKKLAMQKFGYPYQTDYYFIDGTEKISEKDGAFANFENHEAMGQLYTVYGAETDFIASEFSGSIDYIKNDDGTYKAKRLSFSKKGFFDIEGYDIGSKILSDELETLKAKYKSEFGLNLKVGLSNDDQSIIEYVELSK